MLFYSHHTGKARLTQTRGSKAAAQEKKARVLLLSICSLVKYDFDISLRRVTVKQDKNKQLKRNVVGDKSYVYRILSYTHQSLP
jgi:hypothetical protein